MSLLNLTAFVERIRFMNAFLFWLGFYNSFKWILRFDIMNINVMKSEAHYV